MAKHRATLKDIAQKLGITVPTVSKALKNYPDINEETKRRVHELAQQLNYQPDTQALALKGNKSFTIGLIIPEIVHFFFSNVINGIMNYAEAHGYRTLITLSNNSTELEAKQVNLLFRTKVDGVLVSLANETTDANHFNLLGDYEIPLVMLDKIDPNFKCSKVVIDDVHGAYTATKHLIERGCKRIAHIKGPRVPLNAIQRFEGYRKALEEAGMVVDPDLVKECKEVIYEEGHRFTKELMSLPQPPDGLFTVTDQVGVGALNAVIEAGFRVPDEVKILGFSDSQIAQVSQPALTTIHQPGYEIGEAAAKLLIQEIEAGNGESNNATNYKKIVLDTHLIRRGST